MNSKFLYRIRNTIIEYYYYQRTLQTLVKPCSSFPIIKIDTSGYLLTFDGWYERRGRQIKTYIHPVRRGCIRSSDIWAEMVEKGLPSFLLRLGSQLNEFDVLYPSQQSQSNQQWCEKLKEITLLIIFIFLISRFIHLEFTWNQYL